MSRLQASIDTPCHYEVIGEHLHDPTHLLALGDDGQFYALNLLDGRTEPAQVGEEWVIDSCDLSEKLSNLRLNEPVQAIPVP